MIYNHSFANYLQNSLLFPTATASMKYFYSIVTFHVSHFQNYYAWRALIANLIIYSKTPDLLRCPTKQGGCKNDTRYSLFVY